MIIDFSDLRLFIKPGSTDMRKQVNGLSAIIQEELQMDPFSGSLFLFCNNSRKLLKIIYWDRTGFCLWMKRLEKDKFPWPKDSEEAKEVSLEQFKQLLNGIDFWKAHKTVSFDSVL